MTGKTLEEKFEGHFRNKVVNENSRRPGLHVSDLVGECQRKPWYRMNDTGNIIKQDYNFESLTNFYVGTVMHESFEGMFNKMELNLCVNPFEEVDEHEMTDINKEMRDNPYKWVSGSFDAIATADDDMSPEDMDTIVDYKTTFKPVSEPSPQYIRQINMYAYMYYVTTGIKIEKGALIYLIKNSGFRKYRIFRFALVEPEETRLFMMDVMSTIGQEKIPDKTPHIFCTTCEYKNTCEPHGYYNYIQKKYIV